MTNIRDLPIRRKLRLVILIACALALSLAAAVVGVLDILSVRKTMVHDANVMADVIARNIQASLAFGDPDAAASTLRSLELTPDVAMACIYDAGGREFARYVRGNRAPVFAASPAADGHVFTGEVLALFRPVMLGEKRIGTIYVASSLTRIYDRLRQLGAVGVAIIAGALLVAYVVSQQLQTVITEPLLALTNTSRVIAERGDFSVRAARMGNDEIGQLTSVFNQMLDALAELNEQLESKVRDRTAQLQRSNHELESFSYSVSHDLRAPLRAIDGFARMLDEDYGAVLRDDGRRLLGVVREEARRMGVLIDDLLDFSRLSRQALRPLPLNLASMAEDVVSTLRNASPGRTIELSCAPMPPALADQATVRQVLVNLLSNAVKYAKREGVVRIEIGGARDGTMNHYSVRDHGVGFDMRYVDKIFGVFQRLHGDEFEGTGVGLAIVERIVARHGGTVRAEGTLGEGACFHFTLPAAEEEGRFEP
ncbi:MAG TPA: ATP-binding protein [Thermoanaerobaculia bacterium]|nr:ATP-binding protein [Thermoanaerobaculia bacterium]